MALRVDELGKCRLLVDKKVLDQSKRGLSLEDLEGLFESADFMTSLYHLFGDSNSGKLTVNEWIKSLRTNLG